MIKVMKESSKDVQNIIDKGGVGILDELDNYSDEELVNIYKEILKIRTNIEEGMIAISRQMRSRGKHKMISSLKESREYNYKEIDSKTVPDSDGFNTD